VNTPHTRRLLHLPKLNVDPSVLAFDLTSMHFELGLNNPVAPAKPLGSPTDTQDDDVFAAAAGP